jgi:hypothetical protein
MDADARPIPVGLFERWQPVLRACGRRSTKPTSTPGCGVHQPIALVAQDGLEPLPVPWEHLQALFIGGSTQWKLGPHAASLVREAKERGKWVHVGRVNTLQRIRWCMALGVDSIDGSGFARFTRTRLPMGVAALTGPTQQTLL